MQEAKYPSYFYEFCCTTGIRGFSFIKNSINLTEKILWISVVVVCIGLTTWDVTETFKKYLSHPTSTKIMVMANKSISLGDPTMCIEMDVGHFNTAGWNLRNETEMDEFISTLPSNFAIEKYISAELSDESFDIRNIPASEANNRSSPAYKFLQFKPTNRRIRPIIALTTAVLSALIRHESLSGGQLSSFTWSPTSFINYEVQFIEDSRSQSIFKFFTFLLKDPNLNLTSLVGWTANLLCRMLDIQLIIQRYDKAEAKTLTKLGSPCSLESVTWLGFPPLTDPQNEVLCVKLTGVFDTAMRFSSTLETTRVSLDPTGLYDGPTRPLQIHFDFSGAQAVTHMSQNIMSIAQQPKIVTSVVQILGHYKQLSTSAKPCTALTTFSRCRIECRMNFIQDKCGCRPISWMHSSSSLAPCEQVANVTSKRQFPFISADSDCLKFTLVEQPDEICSKGCQRECERILLSLYTLSENNKDDNNTQLELSIDPFVYPFFEEFELIDFRQFLGTLGGNLSFWLGASFIVLLHVIIFIIRIPIQERRKRLQLSPKFDTTKDLGIMMD